MSKSTEQSIKHKLKDISKRLNTPFNTLLEMLFLERFLVRIGKSVYADKLIFKGGMCLAQFLDLGRKTKDIDFLFTQVKNNIEKIKKTMEGIASINTGDNFIFSQVEVNQLPFEHKQYPSYRVYIQGQLGQIKNKVSIDVGGGDVFVSKPLEIKLMTAKEPLFEKSVKLRSYTPEYIFSEKLEAILQLGETNSRMKDFYDCYRLIEESIMDKNLLKTAIHKTMKHRNTKLKMIPQPNEQLKIRWESFLRRNKISDLKLSAIISKINKMISLDRS
ncbi:MAG: nucleotidyl transferase AbiEii/AbiGii toxin family protein [Bdellovibrionales bacterium]|nr:nucleotidyl transferase AbiEii/AbiGii toxin family protein [Bdellovibrionales bacterium]